MPAHAGSAWAVARVNKGLAWLALQYDELHDHLYASDSAACAYSNSQNIVRESVTRCRPCWCCCRLISSTSDHYLSCAKSHSTPATAGCSGMVAKARKVHNLHQQPRAVESGRLPASSAGKISKHATRQQSAPEDWALLLLADAAASVSEQDADIRDAPRGARTEAAANAASDSSSCAGNSTRSAALCAAVSSAAGAPAQAPAAPPAADLTVAGAHTIPERIALARRFAASLQPCQDNIPGKIYMSERVLAIAEARDEKARAAAKSPPRLFRLLVQWRGFAVQFSTWESMGKFLADTGDHYKAQVGKLRAELLAADAPLLAVEMGAKELRELLSLRGGTAKTPGAARGTPPASPGHASAATTWAHS